jgi:hypothetical protein
MAFWKYDRYPGILCGTITEVLDNGLAKIKEYGNGCFRPILVLPKEAGLKLKEELEILEKDHLKRLKEVQKESSNKINSLTEKYKISLK